MQKLSVNNQMSLCVGNQQTLVISGKIVISIYTSIIFCTIIFVADIFLILECVIRYNKMYYMFTCRNSHARRKGHRRS